MSSYYGSQDGYDCCPQEMNQFSGGRAQHGDYLKLPDGTLMPVDSNQIHNMNFIRETYSKSRASNQNQPVLNEDGYGTGFNSTKVKAPIQYRYSAQKQPSVYDGEMQGSYEQRNLTDTYGGYQKVGQKIGLNNCSLYDKGEMAEQYMYPNRKVPTNSYFQRVSAGKTEGGETQEVNQNLKRYGAKNVYRTPYGYTCEDTYYGLIDGRTGEPLKMNRNELNKLLSGGKEQQAQGYEQQVQQLQNPQQELTNENIQYVCPENVQERFIKKVSQSQAKTKRCRSVNRNYEENYQQNPGLQSDQKVREEDLEDFYQRKNLSNISVRGAEGLNTNSFSTLGTANRFLNKRGSKSPELGKINSSLKILRPDNQDYENYPIQTTGAIEGNGSSYMRSKGTRTLVMQNGQQYSQERPLSGGIENRNYSKLSNFQQAYGIYNPSGKRECGCQNCRKANLNNNNIYEKRDCSNTLRNLQYENQYNVTDQQISGQSFAGQTLFRQPGSEVYQNVQSIDLDGQGGKTNCSYYESKDLSRETRSGKIIVDRNTMKPIPMSTTKVSLGRQTNEMIPRTGLEQPMIAQQCQTFQQNQSYQPCHQCPYHYQY